MRNAGGRLVLTAFLMAIAAPDANAAPRETLVTVAFQALGQDPPSKLCVVADYMTAPSVATTPAGLEASIAADSEAPSMPGKPASPATAPGSSTCDQDPTCQMLVEPLVEMPKQLSRQCVPGTGKGGIAVLYFANVEVMGEPTLIEGVARIRLGVSPKSLPEPVQAQLIGGHYWPDSPVPVQLTENAQLVPMTLRPRCFERDVTIPDHKGQCAAPEWTGATAGTHTGDSYRPCLHNEQHGSSTVKASICNHVFKAEWSGDRLPDQVRLETEVFHFDWHQNCLIGNECPAVGGDVHCGDGKPVFGENVCRYTCSGATRFPAAVRFSFGPGRQSGAASWTDTLTAPGQELASFISPEQRSVRLSWAWNEHDRQGRSTRAGRAADTIDYVQIRTPGGQIHNVLPTAEQIRIPELDCDDSVSYRYVGSRLFREQPSQVQADGGDVPGKSARASAALGEVELQDPSQVRTDNVGIALAFGAGGRGVRGGGSAVWGPYAQAQVILVFRQLRDWAPLRSNKVGVDIDLRGGAIFLGQPYCSIVETSDSPGTCAWEYVPFWQIPFTLGPNFLLASNWTLGFGIGATLQTYHLSQDAPKVGRPLLFTAVAHVGYRLSRAMTVEAQAEVLGAEDIRERTFDEAGVLSDVQASDSGLAVLLGGLVRVDNLF
jgi:hypothetical protein